MERIINEVTEELKRDFIEFFKEGNVEIGIAEKYFTERIAEVTLKLLRICYEEADQEIRENKAARKQAGLTVERRGEKRELLTQLGRLEYRRTYYKKASGGYEYPVDEIAGVRAYERLSERVGLSLVEASLSMSYGKASRYVTNGHVSRQTVMNKIREASPRQELVEYRAVQELHIDADEDHVHLRDGGTGIVPLISVYEGIERRGKRGICRNVFHISEFGKSPLDLWEQVGDELERRYDLSNARIYLHGDGASWIRAGLEFLPNCKFVLDRYHKNKAIRQALSGISQKSASQYEFQIRQALNNGDCCRLLSIRETLLERFPERKETILDNTDYLLNNFEAITIANRDKAALNGGCTEPHVSHVLSSRLSSRPMGWSRETLRCFVSLLASGTATFDEVPAPEVSMYPSTAAFLKESQKRYLPGTLGLPDPDTARPFPARTNKVTPLFNALRPF